jgi:DNA-binding transcriptional regulator WhiA
MEHVKNEILESLKQLFDDYMKMDDITYERIRWELDNMIYPYIGSFLADGSITKEEGREIFLFCETKLKEIKTLLEMR